MSGPHLTTDQMVQYSEGKTPPHQLLDTDDHLAVCEDCRAGVNERVAVRGAETLAAFLLVDSGPHLSYQELEEYVDGAISGAALRTADEHLHGCDTCTRQVRDLRELASAVKAPGAMAEEPAARTSAAGWRSFRWMAIPVLAALAAIILAGIWLNRYRATEPETAGAIPAPVTTPAPAPDATDEHGTNTSVAPVKAVVDLADGPGRIEVDPNGNVSGVSDPEFTNLVGRALTTGQIPLSADEQKLKGSVGTLMGGAVDGVPFALTSPIGTLVEADRPTFAWKPLSGAETYRVDIFDESFQRVGGSGPVKTTRWQMVSPLKRGSVYRWQVTATKDGREIVSPVRPAPDAQFQVIAAAAARTLDAARSRHGNSHLIMGIAYSQAGLLDKAEREFQILVQKNPNSPIARRLLERVRAAR